MDGFVASVNAQIREEERRALERGRQKQTLAELMALVEEYAHVHAGYCCGPINRDEPEQFYRQIEQRLRQVLDSHA